MQSGKRFQSDDPFTCATTSNTFSDGDERIVVNETILHEVLYGRWLEWNGRRPSSDIRRKILENLPKNVLKNTPVEVYFDVSTIPFGRIGIFAASKIEEKTVIGPLPGRLVNPSDEIIDDAWEIVDDSGNFFHLLKNEKGHTESWMSYIQCARHLQEQNLETTQIDGDIYYRVIRDITEDNELLVWYGFNIKQCFGIPYFEDKSSPGKHFDAVTGNSEVHLQQLADEKKKLNCVVCQKGFNSRSNLRSHMRTHTLQKPFKCSVCQRRFSQSSTLRNHIRLHTGERPYKCNICLSAYSQLAGLRAHQKSSQHRPTIRKTYLINK